MTTNDDLKKETDEIVLERALTDLTHDPRLTPGSRIMVAMSGGVDSSVVAALLHHAGFEVFGVSMHLFDKGQILDDTGKCCTLDDFQDARRVAFEMGFPHYVVDFRDRFKGEVIDGFVSDYRNGKTPSPCIRCNQHLKFNTLIDQAAALGAQFVATGHYARIIPDHGVFRLLTGQDRHKDQAYFLFHHTQASLARTLFPLGGLRKPEVRALGRALGLHLAEKGESQEICFVPGHYGDFLQTQGIAPREGEIRHCDGRLLGTHEGYWNYTVGQRRGLRIAAPDPLYVVRIDPETQTVWVGEEPFLYASGANLEGLTWVGTPPESTLRCQVKIRSRAPEQPATLRLGPNNQAEILFDTPQRAVAPGQAAVFLDGEEILGGGWIQSGR